MIVDIPLGDTVDKSGCRKLILAALAILFIQGASLIFVNSLIGLVIFLIGFGIFARAVHIPCIAYVMQSSPKKKASEFLGIEFSFIHLGFGLGPIIVGFLLPFLKVRLILAAILFSTTCFLSFLIAFFTIEENKKKISVFNGLKKVVVSDKVYLKELNDFKKLGKTGLTVLFLTFIITFFDGIIWTLEPLYYMKFSGNILWGGLIISAFVMPLILFQGVAGAFADRHGRRKALALGMFTAGFFTIMFGLVDTPFNLFLTAFLAATGISIAFPAIEGILCVHTKCGSEGETIGVWTVANDMGYVLGPIFAGLSAKYVGMSNVFIATGLLFCLSVISIYYIKD